MKTLDDWLDDMLADLPEAVADAGTGEGLAVVDFEVQVPIEARVRAGGLSVSVPRGRLATGFDAPRGQLRVRVGREDE